MKKALNILIIAITIVLFTAPLFMAQEIAQQAPSSVQDAFVEYFASLAGLAALTLAATQWVKKGFEALKIVLSGTIAGMLSWFVALLICTAGYFFNLGILAGVQWYFIIIYGLAVGLVANGLFALEHVTTILGAFKLIPKKAE